MTLTPRELGITSLFSNVTLLIPRINLVFSELFARFYVSLKP